MRVSGKQNAPTVIFSDKCDARSIRKRIIGDEPRGGQPLDVKEVNSFGDVALNDYELAPDTVAESPDQASGGKETIPSDGKETLNDGKEPLPPVGEEFPEKTAFIPGVPVFPPNIPFSP